MKNKIKKIILLIFITVSVIGTCIFVFNRLNSDGMENTNEVSIYYKTYTEEEGWSKWSKNGVTSGDYINSIKNIQIKVKAKGNGYVSYKIYSNDNWDDFTGQDKTYNQINGVKFYNINNLYRKYDICYRTYNKENKWLGWACNGKASGNKEKAITAIDIKIIPKNIIKNEWLKDYNVGNIKPSIAF